MNDFSAKFEPDKKQSSGLFQVRTGGAPGGDIYAAKKQGAV
ncbi:MAG: hypothetical protein ACU0DI_14225 [Paracoccaceae bacterium]